MRITIIKGDNHIYIDGIAYNVDCSELPPEFHALQWYDTWGDLETMDEKRKHGNQEIFDISPWQHLIDRAVNVKATNEAAKAAQAEIDKANAAKTATGEVKIIAG